MQSGKKTRVRTLATGQIPEPQRKMKQKKSTKASPASPASPASKASPAASPASPAASPASPAASPASPASPAASLAAQRKLVGFSREPFIPSFVGNASVKVLPFQDVETQKLYCWFPAKQTATEFCSQNNLWTRTDKNVLPGRTPIVKLHMPIKDQFFISKTVRIKGAGSLLKVLETIESFVKDAVAYWFGQDSVEGVDTLSRFTTCHLMVSRAGGYHKIYIRSPV
jgi:hypothetical protein